MKSHMTRTAATLALVLFAAPVQARGSLGLDSFLWVGLAFAAAVLVCFITVGGPIALINKLTGRALTDEDGGKIFALSFFVGPVIAMLLVFLFGREEFGTCLVLGYLAAIFLLNHWFKKLPPK